MNKIILIVVAVVVIAGGGVFLITKNNKNDDTKITNTNTNQSSDTKTNSINTDESKEQTSSPSLSSNSKTVEINNFAFTPSSLTIKKGTTVTWTNKDSAEHNVVSTDSGKLNSKTLNKGDAYSFTFDQTGTFSYKCTFHPNMTATVTVTE